MTCLANFIEVVTKYGKFFTSCIPHSAHYEQSLYRVVSLQGMFDFESWLQNEIKAWYIFKKKKSAFLSAFKSG